MKTRFKKNENISYEITNILENNNFRNNQNYIIGELDSRFVSYNIYSIKNINGSKLYDNNGYINTKNISQFYYIDKGLTKLLINIMSPFTLMILLFSIIILSYIFIKIYGAKIFMDFFMNNTNIVMSIAFPFSIFLMIMLTYNSKQEKRKNTFNVFKLKPNSNKLYLK